MVLLDYEEHRVVPRTMGLSIGYLGWVGGGLVGLQLNGGVEAWQLQQQNTGGRSPVVGLETLEDVVSPPVEQPPS